MVGRQHEMRLLRDLAAEDRSRFVVVYGRRRVGKTFLIRETFNYQFTFTHTGIEKGSLADQLKSFYESLRDQGLPEDEMPKDWIEAFHLLKQLVKTSPENRKLIFIDELPWMDTPRSRFVSALEQFWNGWCSARKDIVLIVCGSATSWMIRKVLRNKGGLFNRANRVIYLQPFTLRECEEYVRAQGLEMGRREIVEGYMIFGGVPYYWSLLQRGLSLAQNIDILCFTSAGELAGEFKRLYASVFRRAESHLKIVRALSLSRYGKTREEIEKATGLAKNGKLTTLLEELEESGFIRRMAPYGRTKRGSVYMLVDGFTLFHLAFMDGKPTARKGFWLDAVDTTARHIWEGLAFERVCFLHVDEIKAALGIAGVSTEVYEWRSAAGEAQIDMVIDRKDGIINLCEMKFSAGPYEIKGPYADRLLERRGLFKDETGTKSSVHLTFVTSAGLKRNEHASIVQSEVTLQDLFK